MNNTNNLLSTIVTNNETIYRNTQGVHDYAYSFGYGVGNNQGYMEGLEAGKEEEKNRTDVYVERSKEAIIDQNGEISSDAGIEELPDAILSIPVSYTDDEIAYQKTVPMRAQAKSALLKRIGGMTYKCNNLFPILPWANRTISGITFRLDDDGVYHLSGTATGTLFTSLEQNLPIGKYTLSLNCNKQIGTGFTNAVYVTARSADGEWRIVHSTHSSNTYITRTTTVDIVNVTLAIMEGVNCDGLTIAPMLNKGDYIPYEPFFEGLGDSKVKEIVSHGANLFPYPYRITTLTSDGITLTDNGDGSVTLNGTPTKGFVTILSASIKVKDGTYTIGKISDAAIKSGVYAQLFYKASDGSYKTWNISNQPVTLTMSKDITYSFQLAVDAGVTVSNVTVYPMLNEGPTAFPYALYREPISKPIPKALQNIDGWGWGINEDYFNYADYEDEHFSKHTDRQAVADAILDIPDGGGFVRIYFSKACFGDPFGYGICSHFDIVRNYASEIANGQGMISSSQNCVFFKTDLSVEDFRTQYADAVIEYALAEPVITDISEDRKSVV